MSNAANRKKMYYSNSLNGEAGAVARKDFN